MKTGKKAKTLLLALAVAGIPLITTATCNPRFGTLDIYRDDGHHDYDVVDVILGGGYYDDYYYYDDCYYDDCYYEEIIIYD